MVSVNQDRHLAVFLPLLVGGGAERVMLNLIEGFVARGVRVDMVLSSAQGPFLKQVPQAARIVDLQASRALTSMVPLSRYLKKNRPDALVSGLDHANLVALWAAKLAAVKTRTVVTLHDTVSVKLQHAKLFGKGKTYPFLFRRFLPWADVLVAVSRGVADDYSRLSDVPIERFRVIYNPVLTAELHRKSREPLDHPWFHEKAPPVIISVGRLAKQKNFSCLISAFARVRKHVDTRLMILGEGEQRPMLEAMVGELGLQEDVQMPGFDLNPYRYLARSALFVLSSKWEGLPTVLIEALGVGLPVVSTNCKSGPDEILKGGTLGRLVPIDDVGALADAIQEALANRISRPEPKDLEPYGPEWAVDRYLETIFAAG